MTIQIKLKNTSARPITLASVEPALTIDAGKEATAPLEVLAGADVADHVAAGALALSRDGLDELDADLRATATRAIGALALRVAPRFADHHAALAAAVAELADLRDRYNQHREVAVKLLATAKAMTPGARGVIAAIELGTAIEGDVVAAAADALTAHLTKLPSTTAELEAWFAEHKALEARLRAAEVAAVAARSELSHQLAAAHDALAAAAAAFEKADPARDVGAKVTWGP